MRPLLVVDDEPFIRSFLTGVARSKGLEALIASGPREGLDLYAQRPEAVVLTDLTMPYGNLGGPEAYLDAYRALNEHAQIWAMSGYPRENYPYVEGRIDGYLEKPFTIAQLEPIIALLSKNVSGAGG